MESSPNKPSEEVDLSDSVKNVINRLSKKGKVNAKEIIDELLSDHTGYVPPNTISSGYNKTAEDWIKEVYSLYDQEKMRSLLEKPVLLTEKHVIPGLCAIEQDLGKQLLEDDFLDTIVGEVESQIKESFTSLLTNKGQKLWLELKRSNTSYYVPNFTDDPAKVDILGRKAFAKMLAMRLRRLRNENKYLFCWDEIPGNDSIKLIEFLERDFGINWVKKESIEKSEDGRTISFSEGTNSLSFRLNNQKTRAILKINDVRVYELVVKIENNRLNLYGVTRLGAMLVHIHGPWGSGKSSFLNFLSEELHGGNNDSSPWVIVKFNAWQHQRLGHPWWSLMDTVFKKALPQVSGKQRSYIMFNEWKWRLGPGWLHYSLSVVFLLIAIFLFFQMNEQNSIESANNYIGMYSGIIALVGAISSGALGLGRSLLPGSARAATTFMESTNGPLQAIKDHFCDMMEKMNQPVAIFIDDLDRCQVDYTVELLEGIQTLFRETEVTYVVAADKRWLCTSYEKVYNDFIDTVNEPGRPLGHLFIEKTFQFTVSLPRLSPKRKKDYWQHLMSINKSKQKDQYKARIDAQQRLKELRTEKEITQVLKMSSNDPIYDQAIREAAIVRLAEKDVEENTEEHILKQFADLMEPNPRSMKRFANSYGVQMAMDIMRGGSMETEKLALWTIILLRWPLLAEFLEEHPEMVEFIGNESIPDDRIPQHLQRLFMDSNIIDVIKGKGVGVMLDEDTIRNLNDLPVKNRMYK
ncbi:MAG: hypothetical protein C3F06_11660 [Candidatus Methanoperedenaceae archaeon]|nr:MAG: hypothetical protein C3F06_11660 [Candidatus Methanoperedenaceae archaeon]